MTREGFYEASAFGVAPDGQTDNANALQAAVDAAAEAGGGVVCLGPGRYRIEGSIHIKPGVTILGDHDAPIGFNQPTNTIILATGGRGTEEGPALFEMGDSSMLRALSIWWPHQKPDDIQPYPWAVRMTGSDNTVECVTFINAYNGIRVGPEANCRHRIRSVHGCFLRRGFYIDNTWEIGRIENCQLHPHWWSEGFGGDYGKTCEYMMKNLEMFIFGRTDWEYCTNNFVFACKVGWRFIRTENGECNGHLTGCGADGTNTAVLVERLQKMGMLITGGEFTVTQGKNPVQVRVPKECDQGSLRFVNCAFWGLGDHVASLEGGIYVSFNDCFFTNWKEGVVENPIIVAEAGRLQLNNCTFDAPHPAVRLGAGLRHAIVRGNNGHFGVRIQDHTGGKAIIADNEPELPITDPLAHMPEVPGGSG